MSQVILASVVSVVFIRVFDLDLAFKHSRLSPKAVSGTSIGGVVVEG